MPFNSNLVEWCLWVENKKIYLFRHQFQRKLTVKKTEKNEGLFAVESVTSSSSTVLP